MEGCRAHGGDGVGRGTGGGVGGGAGGDVGGGPGGGGGGVGGGGGAPEELRPASELQLRLLRLFHFFR